MGRHHARVYRELDDADLVGVADADPSAVATVARQNSCAGFSDHLALIDKTGPDAVSIAVSTAQHFGVVRDCLQRGVHVLVEKPVASTLAEAAGMAAAAEAAGMVLMVGHIERFNPAVQELKRRLDEGELGRVFSAKARRIGPFPERVRDVGVVIDLATHDLDVMRYLFHAEADHVFAETRREVHTLAEDMVYGLVRFGGGIVGALEVNWLTPTKVRELTVTGERGMFRADYLTQDLFFFENASPARDRWGPISVLRGVSEGAMIRYAIPKREPLKNQLDAFLAAVRGQVPNPVSAEDGSMALRLALALIESGRDGRVVKMGIEY